MNLATVLRCPTLFFCRNNGYAISTPLRAQYHGDGVAGRAAGYGMRYIRVDGLDAVAVHEATREARSVALRESCPVLVEVGLGAELHHHN